MNYIGHLGHENFERYVYLILQRQDVPYSHVWPKFRL